MQLIQKSEVNEAGVKDWWIHQHWYFILSTCNTIAELLFYHSCTTLVPLFYPSYPGSSPIFLWGGAWVRGVKVYHHWLVTVLCFFFFHINGGTKMTKHSLSTSTRGWQREIFSLINTSIRNVAVNSCQSWESSSLRPLHFRSKWRVY